MQHQSFYQHIVPNHELPFRILVHESGKQHTVLNHWHNSFEIDFVISGENSNFYLDGKTFDQKAGEIVVVNPYQVHGLNLPAQKGRVAITIMIPLAFLKQLGFDFNKYHLQNLIKVSKKEQYYDLRRLFIKLYSVTEKNSTDVKRGYLLNQIGLTYQIMGQLLNNYSVMDNRSNVNVEGINILDDAINFMNNNFRKALQIKDIADHCNMSESYFSHTFKNFMKETPMQYLNQIRVIHSLELLKNSDLTTSNIAINIGFTNVKSFNKEFKKQYGTTPYDYKKKSRI